MMHSYKIIITEARPAVVANDSLQIPSAYKINEENHSASYP